MQTLDEEIEAEEESEWSSRLLNCHSELENSWRDCIAKLETYPEEVQPKLKFLGGKQVHRAIEFFRYVTYACIAT